MDKNVHLKNYQRLFDSNRGIYAIVCDELKRAYVGKSKNIPSRIRNHKSVLRARTYRGGKMWQLQEDWDRLGEGAFVFKQLCECGDGVNLYEQETIYCKEFLDEGYDMYNVFVNTELSMVNCPEKYADIIRNVIDVLDKGVISPMQLQENLDYIESNAGGF